METHNTSIDRANTKKAERLSILISIDMKGIGEWNILMFIGLFPEKIFIIEADAPKIDAVIHNKWDIILHNFCRFIKARDAAAASKKSKTDTCNKTYVEIISIREIDLPNF